VVGRGSGQCGALIDLARREPDSRDNSEISERKLPSVAPAVEDNTAVRTDLRGFRMHFVLYVCPDSTVIQ